VKKNTITIENTTPNLNLIESFNINNLKYDSDILTNIADDFFTKKSELENIYILISEIKHPDKNKVVTKNLLNTLVNNEIYNLISSNRISYMQNLLYLLRKEIIQNSKNFPLNDTIKKAHTIKIFEPDNYINDRDDYLNYENEHEKFQERLALKTSAEIYTILTKPNGFVFKSSQFLKARPNIENFKNRFITACKATYINNIENIGILIIESLPYKPYKSIKESDQQKYDTLVNDDIQTVIKSQELKVQVDKIKNYIDWYIAAKPYDLKIKNILINYNNKIFKNNSL
jgi:hypothetical protein